MIPTISCSRVRLRLSPKHPLLAILLSLAVFVTACSAVQIEEAPRPDEPVALLAEERSERDLALSDLRLSPDLSRAIEVPGGATSLWLQVTVENRGTVDETEVLVEAWLRAPAPHGGMVLLQGAELVPLLPAGEAQAIQIAASGVVPILPSYVLEVSVRPALQEQYLGDNVVQYEISVSGTDSPRG